MPASEKLTIETPEQIALEFPLASAGSRFLALAIDTALQIGGFVALGLVALLASYARVTLPSVFGTWALAIVVLLAFTLYYGYFALFEMLWNGQTPGKRLVHLRVITTSGRPITPYAALIRNLLRIVDQLPFVYTVGLIAVFFTERNQRLGDLAADTVVVHEQPAQRPVADVMSEPVRRAASVHRGAARLTPQELAAVEMFLGRRQELSEPHRASTAAALASRIRRRLDVTERDDDDEALLEDVAAEARGGYR